MEKVILTKERRDLIQFWFREEFFPTVKTEYGEYDSSQVRNMFNHILKHDVGSEYSKGIQMILVEVRKKYVEIKRNS